MRRDQSLFVVMALSVILGIHLLLPVPGWGVGVCRTPGKCPCSKEQERQGMKTIGGNCVDCAAIAKALDDLRSDWITFNNEYEKQKERENQGRIKSDLHWYNFQQELPHFSDAARGFADLPRRAYKIGRAIGDSTSAGPYRLRSQLQAAARDVGQMVDLIKSPYDLGPLISDLTDSVGYADQFLDASERVSSLKRDLDELQKKIEEQLKAKAKCDGKGEKKSEQKSLLENPGTYAAGLPPFLRLVATAGSKDSPGAALCRISQEKLSRCRQASQVLRNIKDIDYRETHRALDDALRALGRFEGDNADKMPDQEVLERAKQAEQALKSLAELLDRLVSRSNEVLALLQGSQ